MVLHDRSASIEALEHSLFSITRKYDKIFLAKKQNKKSRNVYVKLKVDTFPVPPVLVAPVLKSLVSRLDTTVVGSILLT